MNADRKLITRSAADIARADGIGEPRVPGFWYREHVGGRRYHDRFVDFHDWMTEQIERDDPIGDLARDYSYGVSEGLHEKATDPSSLMKIVNAANGCLDAEYAVEDAEREWESALERFRIK